MMKVMVRDKIGDNENEKDNDDENDDDDNENVKRGGGCMTTRERVR